MAGGEEAGEDAPQFRSPTTCKELGVGLGERECARGPFEAIPTGAGTGEVPELGVTRSP